MGKLVNSMSFSAGNPLKRSIGFNCPTGEEMTLEDLRKLVTLALQADFSDDSLVRVVNRINGKVKSMTIKEEG